MSHCIDLGSTPLSSVPELFGNPYNASCYFWPMHSCLLLCFPVSARHDLHSPCNCFRASLGSIRETTRSAAPVAGCCKLAYIEGLQVAADVRRAVRIVLIATRAEEPMHVSAKLVPQSVSPSQPRIGSWRFEVVLASGFWEPHVVLPWVFKKLG